MHKNVINGSNAKIAKAATINTAKKFDNQVLIYYRVYLGSNCQFYDQVIESPECPFPIECQDESPLKARARAFSIAVGDATLNKIFKPSDFKVFLVDNSTGKEFLISNFADPTIELHTKLAMEYQLYQKYGYNPNGFKILYDSAGLKYKVIDDQKMVEPSAEVNIPKVAVSKYNMYNKLNLRSND